MRTLASIHPPQTRLRTTYWQGRLSRAIWPAMTAPDDIASRRKRLYFRAQRRGFKEVDLIFGAFAETHLNALDAAGLDAFEALMAAPDQDVYGWLQDHAPVPAEFDTPVFAQLKALCRRKSPTWTV